MRAAITTTSVCCIAAMHRFMTPYIAPAEVAEQLMRWLKERGGILIWSDHWQQVTPFRYTGGATVINPNWINSWEPARYISDHSEVVVRNVGGTQVPLAEFLKNQSEASGPSLSEVR